jgi:hypothetical protein
MAENMKQYYIDPSSTTMAAPIPYPPCEGGVTVFFPLEPSKTYSATALFYTAGNTPPNRIDIYRTLSDTPQAIFLEEHANPPRADFNTQLRVDADIPHGEETPVTLQVQSQGAVTLIVVSNAPQPDHNFKDIRV